MGTKRTLWVWREVKRILQQGKDEEGKLTEEGRERIVSQLENYKAQIEARHKRKESEVDADNAASEDPSSDDEIWFS